MSWTKTEAIGYIAQQEMLICENASSLT